MATQIPKVNKELVLVFVSAGVNNGASGWGITPGGKLKKIPDNNPIAHQVAAAAQALAAVERSGRAAQMQDLARVAQSDLVHAAAELAEAFPA
ncbi:MAG TPA: hypothetical protein VFL64_22185 [Rhizobacter sp.]|nr:hypothetical protein [Rhizobacter sp.]